MSLRKQLIILTLLSVSLFASAYDAVGHRIIADIAYQNLTKKAKKQCDKVLGVHGMIYLATWADEIKSDKKYDYSYQWHYQNLKDSMSVEDLKYLMDHPTVDGEHLFYGLNQMEDRLRKNPNDAEALKFLVHFVGDLHQPMHLGRAEDLGGNRVKETWFGRNTNLHAIWDGSLTESKNMSYTEYSHYLQDKFAPQKHTIKTYTLFQSVQRAYEVRSDIYAYELVKPNSNYDYIYHFSADLDEMLYRGGIQLANILNDLFK